MANHRHRGGGSGTRDEQQRSPDRMRNGNQPSDESIKSANLEGGSLGDQHDPLDDVVVDNVRDAPRDSSGVTEGMSTFEKLGDGDIGPVPGAPLDPASEAASPITAPVVVVIALVVLVILVAALAAIL